MQAIAIFLGGNNLGNLVGLIGQKTKKNPKILHHLILNLNMTSL
jgi:hypothetical protein